MGRKRWDGDTECQWPCVSTVSAGETPEHLGGMGQGRVAVLHTKGHLGAPHPHQNVQQLLQVAADDTFILIQGPAALLGIILPPGQVCKDHLQPLLVMADLP